jgi:hypothetical protein
MGERRRRVGRGRRGRGSREEALAESEGEAGNRGSGAGRDEGQEHARWKRSLRCGVGFCGCDGNGGVFFLSFDLRLLR